MNLKTKPLFPYLSDESLKAHPYKTEIEDSLEKIKDTAIKLAKDVILEEISTGTPITYLKDAIAHLIAEDYLEHREVADALQKYRAEQQKRLIIIHDMNQLLKTEDYGNAHVKALQYYELIDQRKNNS